MTDKPPLILQIALHRFCRCDPYAANDPEHRDSEAVRDLTAELIRAGLLKIKPADEYGNTLQATEAMQVYVRALCAVPFPVQRWVMPRNEEDESS